ncbi:MAG: hypothetical protein KIS78_20690 [Labilithrix sp.]|nr:hypothetical protein [Labilithrix sp.]MCW5834835.1 hypothetical protein [Labilithrix sp.]
MRRGVLVPLGIGLAAGALTLVYALVDARRALAAWTAAFGFVLATALGAMVLVMVLHVTGARWWRVLRRVVVAVAGTTPLLALFFLPIAGSLELVYPWAAPPPDLPERVARALAHQQAWHDPRFFLVRSLLYLATWTALSVLLRRADAAMSRRPTAARAARERTLSAAGLPIVAFTLTFAAFDWLMSREAGWVSNVFGVYVFTSGLLSALAVIGVASWMASLRGLTDGAGADHFHAVGRLTLMAVILWAYIAFFQLLLIWIANLPAEVSFYWARSRGSWRTVDVVLVVGRFALPFVLLLSRSLKRSPLFLAALGSWLVVTSALDFEWLVVPAAGASPSLADAAPFVCVFALAWAYGAHLVYTRGRAPEERGAAEDAVRRDALRYRSP